MNPTFTYECPMCGVRWSEQRDRNDPALESATTGCVFPDGSFAGRRVFDPGEVRAVFKGRGWARKDHKDASKP